jgi:hypothetical protein
METTKDIDRDVEVLHEELGGGTRSRKNHHKVGKFIILGVVALTSIMFLFGLLTRTTPTSIAVEEVEATLDAQPPQVVGSELDARLLELRKVAPSGMDRRGSVSSVSVATPRILTWTPDAVGKRNVDGSVVPLSGSYELPPGYVGLIRLLSDGEEIGRASVDSRAYSVPVRGRYTIVPTFEEGQRLVHLTMDAVSACRITCDPYDQICLATDVNHCVPQFDNQSFLAYRPFQQEALPVAGACTERTFVAGPKYAPQIPEDYTMCEKGMLNTNIIGESMDFIRDMTDAPESDLQNYRRELSQVIFGLAQEEKVGNSFDVVEWEANQVRGDSKESRACLMSVRVKINCQ